MLEYNLKVFGGENSILLASRNGQLKTIYDYRASQNLTYSTCAMKKMGVIRDRLIEPMG